jgi:DNA polymerase-3 subunit epsilon
MDEQGSALIPHEDQEATRLQLLIDAARSRLAECEAAYTVLQSKLQALRAAIFERVAEKSRERDEFRLLVGYRADLLSSLKQKDARRAEAAAARFQAESVRTQQEYARAAAEAAQKRDVSPAEEAEIASLWRKLVKLYHPDKLAQNAAKREAYHQLIAAINHARDTGDLLTLRKIAADPHGFLRKRGFEDVDLAEERRLEDLRQLLQSLQGEFERVSALRAQLERSADYELHQLLQRKPEVFEQVIEKQLRQIEGEIVLLKEQAASLKTEIERVTGSPLSER